jgi:ribosomal protein S18 acetylase RimI-like enzyme
MQDAPEAPSWSDAELAGLIPATQSTVSAGRVRRAWVAERVSSGSSDSDHPVGFVVASGLQLPDTTADCELEFLFAVPDQRRSGLGRMLVDAVLTWAGELGAREVWLEVRSSNQAAQSLYRACGFIIKGSRPRYYANPPEDALLMRHQLGQAPPHRPV